MPRKILLHGINITRIALETAGVLVGIILFLLILFLARISLRPIDMGFAGSYVEKALHDPVSGYSVRLGEVILEWPGLKGPMMLDLHNVRLIRDHQVIVSIGRAQLGLSGIYLMAGRIAPVSIILSHPGLHLVRTENNNVRLSLEEAPEAPEPVAANPDDNPFMDVIKTLSAPPGAIGSGSPISHLRSLRVNDASMVVEDHALGVTWFLGHLDLQFAKDEEGLAVTAGIRVPGGRKGNSIIQADAVYSRDANDFHATLHFEDFDPRIISRKIDALSFLNDQDINLDGDATAVIDAGLKIHKATLSVSAADGALNLPGAYAQPLPFRNAGLQAAYDGDTGKATIDKFILQMQDEQVALTTRLTVAGGVVKGPVSVVIPSVTQERIRALWPENLRNGSGYTWIGTRLSDGTVRNFSAALDLEADRQPDESWGFKADNIKSDFDLEGMTVDYRAPLLPIRQARGHGRFADDTLDVGVESGAVGDMKISKGRVVIDHVIAPGIIGTANITVRLDGKLTSVFSYVAPEPINIDPKKIGLDTDRMKGAASLDIAVSFPTTKNLLAKDVVVKVNGPLKDVLLPHVLKAMDLTGDSLMLSVAGGMAGVKGKGKLDGSNIEFEWQEYLDSKDKPFSSRITASGDAGDGLRAKLGLGIEDWVKGTLPVRVVYTEYPGHRSEAVVDADAGPGMLMIAPLNYIKAAGVAARVKCKAVLQDGYLTEVSGLEAKAADLDISGGVLQFGEKDALRSVKLARAKVQENDGAFDLQEGRDGALTLAFKGAFFDARPFLERHKKEKDELYTGPAVKAAIDAAQLRTRAGYVIKNAKVAIDMNSEGLMDRMDVEAVAGKGALALHLKPDAAGNVRLSMNAADAGATLQAFNIYDNVIGGTLTVSGQSSDPQHSRDIRGSAQIADFRVIKAPALAQLVSVISPMGLAQLGSDGIRFSKLESNFLWAMRRRGDVYILTDGRTSGSSLGLTFAGRIDKQTEEMDITGDVVPVSEVNGLIGHIPLIGNILTGGKGGALFAATYALTGPTANPHVAVNPLSVLTPGILRRISFEGGN